MPRYLTIIFSLILAVYLAVALTVTAGESDMRICRGVEIEVEPTAGAAGFVTVDEIASELDSFPSRAGDVPLSALTLHSTFW